LCLAGVGGAVGSDGFWLATFLKRGFVLGNSSYRFNAALNKCDLLVIFLDSGLGGSSSMESIVRSLTAAIWVFFFFSCSTKMTLSKTADFFVLLKTCSGLATTTESNLALKWSKLGYKTEPCYESNLLIEVN
jgi:hypothetical protein